MGPKCPKTFSAPETLAKHAKFFHNVPVKFCNDCKMTFESDSARNQHLCKTHAVSQKQKPSLLKSIENDHENSATYKCPKCPKTYNIGKSLRKHCRKNHNKLSICFCHHCPKVFTSVSQRDNHVNRVHATLSSSPKEAAPQ